MPQTASTTALLRSSVRLARSAGAQVAIRISPAPSSARVTRSTLNEVAKLPTKLAAAIRARATTMARLAPSFGAINPTTTADLFQGRQRETAPTKPQSATDRARL